MSEFTDCVYLKSESLRDGIDWLQQNALRGYLMRPVDGWVQVMPEWPANPEIVRGALHRSDHLLVHYQFAADHLWGFSIYSNDERFFKYSCAWETGTSFELRGSTLVAARLLDVSEDALKTALYMGEVDADFSTLVASAGRFASLVDLPNREWAAYRYVGEQHRAILVEPREELPAEPANLDNLSGVLAKLLILQLTERESIIFDPDTPGIRENMASHLVEVLDEFYVDNLSEVALIWHQAMQKSASIARFRLQPTDLEEVLDGMIRDTIRN